MALLTDTDDSYTKTGKGTLTRWANKLSMIPILGGTATFVLGMVDTALESAQWLFRGKFGSAATALAAGTAGNFVNSLSSFAQPIWWGANLLTGGTTGASMGTHARAVTESIIGSVSGALGSKPQVLASYPAGIGSISSAAVPQGPGKFASSVSAQRGENADQAYARYMSGEGGAHVNELASANGRGA